MFQLHINVWPFQVEKAEERRAFVYRSLMEVAVFFMCAVIQWVVLLLLPRSDTLELAERHESTILLIHVLSVLFFLVFAFSDQVRRMFCLGWVVTLIIVEGLIVSVGLLVLNTDLLRLLIGLLGSTLLIVLIIFVAVFISYDITRDVKVLTRIAFAVFIFSIYAAMLYVTLHLVWPFYLFAALVFLTVTPLLTFHVQCILGNGHIRTQLEDDKLAALLLFTDILALFMLTIYWRPARSVKQ